MPLAPLPGVRVEDRRAGVEGDGRRASAHIPGARLAPRRGARRTASSRSPSIDLRTRAPLLERLSAVRGYPRRPSKLCEPVRGGYGLPSCHGVRRMLTPSRVSD